MGIILKTADEIELMRRAGRINAEALEAVRQAVRPGVTTAELDSIASRVLRQRGARAAFLNYPNRGIPDGKPFPATITASINNELVHGIPGRRRLREGDIISIDCGSVWEGYVGDSAITVAVGQVAPEAQRLIEVTERALELAIEACRPGRRIGDVSATIQEWVESKGFQVVREYTGHGVGRAMHEEPDVPNWGKHDRGALLKRGMTFAIEPMVTVGPSELRVKRDGWTVVTVDGGLCAHAEHTIAITDGAADILTL